MSFKRYTFMLTILVFIFTTSTVVYGSRTINLVPSDTIENSLSRFLRTKVNINGQEYVFQPRQPVEGYWESQSNNTSEVDNRTISVRLEFTRDEVKQQRYIFENTRSFNPETRTILPDLFEALNLQFEGYKVSIDGNPKIDIDTVYDNYGNIYVLQGILNKLGYYNRTTSDGTGLIVYTDTHIFLFKANSNFYAIVPVATDGNYLFHNLLSISTAENNTIFSIEKSNAPILNFEDFFLIPLDVIDTIIQFSSDFYIQDLGVLIDEVDNIITINTFEVLEGNINKGILPQEDLFVTHIPEVMMYLESIEYLLDVRDLVNNYYGDYDFYDVFYNIYQVQTNFYDWIYIQEFNKVQAWNPLGEDIDISNLKNTRLKLMGINDRNWTPYFNDEQGNYYYIEGPFKFLNSNQQLKSFPTWQS